MLFVMPDYFAALSPVDARLVHVKLYFKIIQWHVQKLER